jgi:ectoine hydroxylase-related dioxygenase (phytanoyl-CoA dioxygenase family)
MTHGSKVLTHAQREHYFEAGYVVCEGALDSNWLRRVCNAFDNAIERSREVAESNRWFSLAPEHERDAPCVYRVERLPDQDPEFWSVALESRLADVASDVLGPDVIYRDSMINVKPPGTRGNVGWHQDFPFYPHTNVGTIQVLTALKDVPSEQGPLTILPGSHRHGAYEHYDEDDRWAGEIGENDLGTLDLNSSVELVCAAGDAVVLHPLTVHGSKPNRSSDVRPLLVHGFSAADSLPYTAIAWGNSHTGDTLRGDGRRYAQHDALDVRLPPDWSHGYTSIFEHQQTN